MLSRSTLRSSRLSLTCVKCAQRRAFAAPASGSIAYQTTEVAGTKIATRGLPGPTSTLALVSKAGSRYQWLPGLPEALEKFAFRNTQKRFSLRIIRETELLGSELFSNRTREAVVYGAKFMREDLPYFVELFAEIAGETKYQQHILDELVAPIMEDTHKTFLANTHDLAIDAAHGVAFHRGLGNLLYPNSPLAPSQKLQIEEIEAYAAAAYAKPNFALVGSGVDEAELSKWTGEFFKGIRGAVPQGLPSLESPATKYHGGEARISHGKNNTVVLAFEGSSLPTGSAYKPEIEILASLLGGESAIKWSSGSSLLGKACASHTGVRVNTATSNFTDGGLLYVIITGPASAVAAASKDVAKTIKDVASGQIAKEDLQKAIAQAKFKAFDRDTIASSSLDQVGLSVVTTGKAPSSEQATKAIADVTEAKVKQAAKKLVDSKVSIASIGTLKELPYAEELGLNV